ncbi:MAG: hypothetical protein WCE68_18380 [Anaerolineales bacterium]
MKLFRKALRYWIGIASLLTFLGGWVILAHSPKPVQGLAAQPAVALPTLPPIQAYGSSVNASGIPFFSNIGQAAPQANPQPGSGMPLLITRGS